MSVLEGLEPSGVWARFAELTRIARPPKEEDEARRHVVGWAADNGFETAVDDEGNVVVRIPASASGERADGRPASAPGHGVRAGSRQPVRPAGGTSQRRGRRRLGRAEGTTLGADNGIGVAAALAVAEDPEIAHGPLELLFTVSEEQGLDGAKNLDPGLVSGRLLLNLDGTSDRAITIGCAGSWHTFTRLGSRLESVPGDPRILRGRVSGRARRAFGRRHRTRSGQREQGARPCCLGATRRRRSGSRGSTAV